MQSCIRLQITASLPILFLSTGKVKDISLKYSQLPPANNSEKEKDPTETGKACIQGLSECQLIKKVNGLMSLRVES